MAQKLKIFIVSLGSLLLISCLPALVAHAAPCAGPSVPGCVCSSQGCDDGTAVVSSSDPDCNNPNPTPDSLNSCVKKNGIVHDLNVIVNILSALVGVVVTGVIVLGGVQYAAAGSSPEAVSKAKTRITNGLIALLAFIFTYALLQWLIPGGVFG